MIDFIVLLHYTTTITRLLLRLLLGILLYKNYYYKNVNSFLSRYLFSSVRMHGLLNWLSWAFDNTLIRLILKSSLGLQEEAEKTKGVFWRWELNGSFLRYMDFCFGSGCIWSEGSPPVGSGPSPRIRWGQGTRDKVPPESEGFCTKLKCVAIFCIAGQFCRDVVLYLYFSSYELTVL